MTITLTPELEQIVKDQLAGGQFATPEEVVRVGLQLLRQKYDELKALIAESAEQARNGQIAPLDVKATLARVRALQINPSRSESCGE
jgi:putative addiction module CopG family antidote